MKFSPFVDRIGGKGAQAWELHSEADAAIERGEDVIMLSIGDPEFDTPMPIIDKAVDQLRGGDTHYTGVSGRDELKDAIARDHLRISGQKVNRENVIVLAGAQCALFCTSMCIAGEGDEVITFDPMYATYEATMQASGATMVTVPMEADSGFRPDLKALEAAITPRTRALFIITPHNPTGVMLTRGELEQIAALAKRHDLWVVSDEVYADLTFEGEHVSIAGLAGMAERTVTVSSLSKSRNMPGWRVGWAVGPKELIAHLNNMALCMLYGLPGFIQDAAVVALEACADEPLRLKQIYRERRDYAVKRLNQIPGIRCEAPSAGMFVLGDVRGTGLTSDEFCWQLYRKTGVAVLDAAGLGKGADGFFRMSYTTSQEKLTEACDRISAFCNQL
jgi:arginine:pyruvate transaminase